MIPNLAVIAEALSIAIFRVCVKHFWIFCDLARKTFFGKEP